MRRLNPTSWNKCKFMWWYLVFEVNGSMPRILTKFQKNELGNLPRYVLKVTWKSTSFQLYHMHHTYRRILAVTQTCICKPKHKNNWPYLLKFHSHTGFPFEVSNSMFYVFWGGYEIMVTYIYLLLFLQKQQLAGECVCSFFLFPIPKSVVGGIVCPPTFVANISALKSKSW